MPKFFDALKRHILREPSRDFDRKFWAKFNAEFKARPASGLLAPQRAWWPAAAAAVIAIATGVVLRTQRSERSGPPVETAAAQTATAAILENEELFANLDLLEALDDVAMSDQDWNVLLKGKESADDHT